MDRGSPWWIAGVTLTVAMLALAPLAWRRLGARRGLRWLAVAIVPAGLALSGLAAMFGRMAVAMGQFISSFVFSPFVWVGFGLLGGAVALELASRSMGRRGKGNAPAGGAGAGSKPAVGRSAPQVERGKKAPVDDDMAEIEALLRRRGIT